jgi:hypothetical protein
MNSYQNELKSIHFFNSALFKNEEINLGSNIFISGTNGAGKTTVLRVINFFNTANEKVLKKEKLSFYDYFFKHSNSFLVYRYEKEEYDVLVSVYTKENAEKQSYEDKLLYRFSLLKKDSYDIDNIFNRVRRGDVFNELLEKEISTFEATSSKQYLDILYGNTKNKELGVFVFAKVKNYKNYTELLYSVFKNGAIEARSVKNIILDYVKSEHSATMLLDLNRQERELLSFEKNYHSIEEWKKGEDSIPTLKNHFTTLNTHLYHKKEKLISIAKHINYYEKFIPLLKNKIEEEDKNSEKCKDIIKDIKTEKEEILKNLLEDKIKLELKIDSLSERYKIYRQNSKLLKMIEEVPKNDEYQFSFDSAEEMLKQLDSSKGTVKEQYDVIVKSINDIFKGKKGLLGQSLSKLESEILQKKIDNSKKIEEDKKEIEETYKDMPILLSDKEELSQKKNDEELKLEKIKIKRYEDDNNWKNLVDEFNSENVKKVKIKKNITALDEKKDKLIQKDEAFRENEDLQKEKIEGDYRASKDNIQKKIDSLNEIMESEGTLFSKITNHGLNMNRYVSFLKDEVFLSKDFILNENQDSEKNIVFNFTVDSASELFENSQTIQEKLLELKKEKISAKEKRIKSLAKLKKDYKSFYAEYVKVFSNISEEIGVENNSLSIVKSKIIDIENRQDDFKELWKKKHKKELEKQELNLSKITLKLQKISDKYNELKEKKKLELTALESMIYNEKKDIEEAKGLNESEILKLDGLLKDELLEAKKRYENQLHSDGLDVDEIKKYETIRDNTKAKLLAIHQWQNQVEEYKKFVRNEYEKLSELKIKFKRAEEEENSKTIFYEEELENKGKILLLIDNDIRKLKIESDRYREDAEALEKLVEEIDSIKDKEVLTEVIEIAKREDIFHANVLIFEFHKIEKSISKEEENITKATNVNFGNFIAKKSFEFKSEDILGCAKEIIELDSNSWIQGMVDITYEGIDTTIDEISTQYRNVYDALTHVDGAIRKINKDIEDIREIDLIDVIEMKTEPKESSIMHSMKELSQYWAEESKNMKRDLFSFESYGSHHKPKILKILKKFTDELENSSEREKRMSVGNLFDLLFYVKEKSNEYDWTDKISDAGSEGTSIIIKIAVNTALINLSLKGSQRHQTYLPIDEVGRIHNKYVVQIMKYINAKDTKMIAVQPNDPMAKFFERSYLFESISNKETLITEHTRQKISLKIKAYNE